jgi:hypothetical protein
VNDGSRQSYIQHPTYKLKYKSINLLLQEIKPDLEIELALEKLWWLRQACHE